MSGAYEWTPTDAALESLAGFRRDIRELLVEYQPDLLAEYDLLPETFHPTDQRSPDGKQLNWQNQLDAFLSKHFPQVNWECNRLENFPTLLFERLDGERRWSNIEASQPLVYKTPPHG